MEAPSAGQIFLFEGFISTGAGSSGAMEMPVRPRSKSARALSMCFGSC